MLSWFVAGPVDEHQVPQGPLTRGMVLMLMDGVCSVKGLLEADNEATDTRMNCLLPSLQVFVLCYVGAVLCLLCCVSTQETENRNNKDNHRSGGHREHKPGTTPAPAQGTNPGTNSGTGAGLSTSTGPSTGPAQVQVHAQAQRHTHAQM